jgi:hypothetical protein
LGDEAVRKQFDQLSFTEVLTSVCPGVLLLSSAALWLPLLWANGSFGLLTGVGTVPGSVLVLIVAYGIGLTLNAWAAEGLILFLRLGMERRVKKGVSKGVVTLHYLLVALFHGRRHIPVLVANVESRLAIYDRIRFRCGESVLSLIRPNDFMSVFRVLVWDDAIAREGFALQEANGLARRRGFAESTALGAMLVCVHGWIQLVTVTYLRPPNGRTLAVGLVVVCVGSCLASVVLRRVASRLGIDEQIITFAIARSVGSGATTITKGAAG